MSEPTEPKGPVKASGERPPKEEGRERTDTYTVTLPTFEGPLDLLLHLIQKHELDIRDIPIAFITEKYVEYIRMMEELSIDIASEYLVMAATLAYMKSRTLLPQQPEEEEEGLEAEELDPRAELVRRLLEYQKYKLVAEQLGSRSVYGRDVFGRGSAAPQAEGPAPLAQLSMFKLLDALEGILERFKQTGDHLVDFERISISDRINQLSDVLQSRGRVEFEHLFEGDRSRADVIVTFLALLEMTKLRLTTLWQEEPYAPIYIELAVREEGSEPPSAVPGAAGSEQAPGVAPDGARGAAEDLQPVVASVSEVGEAVQSPNAPAGAVDETEDARPPMASAGEADATEDIHPPTASDEESEESEPPKTFDDE